MTSLIREPHATKKPALTIYVFGLQKYRNIQNIYFRVLFHFRYYLFGRRSWDGEETIKKYGLCIILLAKVLVETEASPA